MELLGIDRDPAALAVSRRRLGGGGIRYLEATYSEPAALAAVADFRPDFVLLDLGVSSRQLDEAERGFTFRPGAPLDMRMGSTGITAADFLAGSSESELERVFGEYGDERQSRRLAYLVRNGLHDGRGRYGFDVTHNLVMNYVWDVPVFSHTRGLLYAALGGEEC